MLPNELCSCSRWRRRGRVLLGLEPGHQVALVGDFMARSVRSVRDGQTLTGGYLGPSPLCSRPETAKTPAATGGAAGVWA